MQPVIDAVCVELGVAVSEKARRQAVAFGHGQTHRQGHQAGAGDVQLQQGDAHTGVEIRTCERPCVQCRGDRAGQRQDDHAQAQACEAVAHHIQGTLALPHAYGRLQFGADLDLHFRTMIGTGANPNVAACVVIGIEPLWTQKVVDGIAATGKPVAGFSIENNGDIATVAAASRRAKEFVHHASIRGPCSAESGRGRAAPRAGSVRKLRPAAAAAPS